MKCHAIQADKTGGPEVLAWREVEVGDPGPGEILVRHQAVGLNYIDTYQRSGLYPPATKPFTLGLEGAGVVEKLARDVTGLKAGDRIAYASPPMGAYAQLRLMPADRVVKVPDGIDHDTAAAMMLKGMTAEYLLRRTYPVKKGDVILFHAAAGGVGLIACQWAKAIGATVIGTVGTDQKAELARAHGCDHPIVYTREDLVARVKEITGGEGVAVVYDSVGKDTFERSLDCLSPRGLLALFGQSSGPVGPFDPAVLAAKGSLYLTRPSLMVYNAKRADLEASAAALFDMVGSGKVKIEINNRYPLAKAAQAHRDLEGRKTTGSTIFEP
ncbi:MAG TPA: quinone oxidoreductase [Alphaproteobacteria bacterium]